MGWFSWGSSEAQPRAKQSADGAFEAPNRSDRARCYEARDAFFECLDRNNILDSIGDKQAVAAAEKACGKFNQEFEKSCAHSWVSASMLPDSMGNTYRPKVLDMESKIWTFSSSRIPFITADHPMRHCRSNISRNRGL